MILANKKPSNIIVVLFLFITALITIFPIYAIFLASLRPAQDLFRFGLNVNIDLANMNFANYLFLFTGDSHYLLWYRNSLFVAVIQTILSCFICALVGYGLAMYEFKLKRILFFLVLVTMIVPMEIMMLPLFRLMINLELVNTYWGLILPALAVPVPIFFFRQYLMSVPKDFLDAGRIDGCNEYMIFFRLILPIMKPAFAAMATLQAVASWNSFLWPMIVLRDRRAFTLPVGFSTLLTPHGNNFDILIAGSVMSIVPILIFFLIFQRNFIAGMTAGSLKG